MFGREGQSKKGALHLERKAVRFVVVFKELGHVPQAACVTLENPVWASASEEPRRNCSVFHDSGALALG